MELLLFYFIDENNWDSDALNDLLKIIKLFSVGAEIQTQVSDYNQMFFDISGMKTKLNCTTYFIHNKYIYI